MKVLVLNSGSSSVKFQFMRMEDEGLLAKGIVEKIGSSDAIVTYQPEGRTRIREIREVLNHSVAIEMVLGLLLHPQHGVIRQKSEIDGIGHRVVHGGEDFSESVLITDKVKATIRKCIQFAPLHNSHNIKGIEACEELLPGVPQVGVFDTAFHQTIPPKAYIYGLPYVLYRKLGIRRYGFHGTRPYVFSARAYEHSVQYYLHLLGDEYGMQIKKAGSIREAVENYIQIGVAGGLFRDANFFELTEVSPFHLEITVHDCVYLRSCQALIEEGFSVRDLTCARIGCFRAAVKALANIDCEYQVTSFNVDGDCKGYIERT